MTNHELTSQLFSLLTKEDFERGYIYMPYDIGISAQIKIGEDMVDRIKEYSPYGDHIIGFARNERKFGLVLDEEGQKLWDEKLSEKIQWISRYGSE
jgi:hypothetical protein